MMMRFTNLQDTGEDNGKTLSARPSSQHSSTSARRLQNGLQTFLSTEVGVVTSLALAVRWQDDSGNGCSQVLNSNSISVGSFCRSGPPPAYRSDRPLETRLLASRLSPLLFIRYRPHTPARALTRNPDGVKMESLRLLGDNVFFAAAGPSDCVLLFEMAGFIGGSQPRYMPGAERRQDNNG